MLKYVAPMAFCVLAWLSACEPNGSESMEPIAAQEPDPPAGKSENPQQNEEGTLDSNAIRALAEVNAWRQKGCLCGDVRYPATTKVQWNTKLYDAALAHAKDMRTHNYFSHTSPSGKMILSAYVQVEKYRVSTTEVISVTIVSGIPA